MAPAQEKTAPAEYPDNHSNTFSEISMPMCGAVPRPTEGAS
jgi:hypothetical protein